MPATITAEAGALAAIHWGHYRAAVLTSYAIGRDGARWSMTGRVVWGDPFKLSQAPLELVIPHATGSWRWPIVTWDRRGDQITAALGAPLEETHGIVFRSA